MTMFRPPASRVNIRQFGGQNGRPWMPGMFSGQAGAPNPATPMGTQNGTPPANTAYAPGNVVNAPPPQERRSNNAQLESSTPTPPQAQSTQVAPGHEFLGGMMANRRPPGAAPVIDTVTPVTPDPWSYKDPATGQARQLDEQGFLGFMQAKLAAGVPLSAMDLSAMNLYAPANQALQQAIMDVVLGKTTTLNYTPGLLRRQPQNSGIVPPVMQTSWAGQTADGIDPVTGQPYQQQASVYDRPVMQTPSARQFTADVDYGQTPARRYSTRVGGVGRGGIYTG